jgi:hypothetical protein
MPTKPSYILTTNGPISVYFGTVTKTVQRTDPNFPRLIDMLKPTSPASTEDILTFLDPARRIKQHACGLFDVCNGGVYIDGERTPDLFSKRALELADLGLDPAPLVALWRNIKRNPSQESVKDLYAFLDHNQHPITPDGCFIAYKAINADFTDKYTGKISNHVGAIVKMDRYLVNADRNQTCSSGLHVASLKYARDSYGGQVLVVCKVNPANVVSVPVDYNQEKMRTCEYTVLEVLEDTSKPLTPPVYNPGVDSQKAAQVDNHQCNGRGTCCIMSVEEVRKATGAKVKRVTDDNHKRQKRDARGHFIPKRQW